MKIFHIVSNKEWGGGEQTVLDLSRRQLADGIDVELFCLPSQDIISRFKELNVPIHVMPLRGAMDFVSAWKMAKVLKNSNAYAVHAHNFKEAFTAAYARKLSGREDIHLLMCRNLTRKGKTSWLYRWLYSQIEHIVFDSQIALDTFVSSNPQISHDKLSVIFNGVVMPEKIIPADIRKEFGIEADEVVIMYHGRLDPEKGLDVLIDAMEKLGCSQRFKLILVGRGSDEYTAHLKEKIARNGLSNKIILAGFRNPVLPYVASCDIGVLPSIVPEGCSLAAQEHMSQGHPIIATDNGGQREYIENGRNGFLVPPGDAQALADAIKLLIENAELRKQMGQQAKNDYDDHLSYERFYAKMKKIYE